MSQEDYIKQIEEDNACLKRKLDEALEKYDTLYNSKDNLRERIREIDIDEMGNLVGVPTKYKITTESYQDFKNMHGLSISIVMKDYSGMNMDSAMKFMKNIMKEQFNV